MGKFQLISLIIFCTLQTANVVIAGSYSLVSVTSYQRIEPSDMEYLRRTSDPAELEFFKTVKLDRKGNYIAPISHYNYTIQHPSLSQGGLDKKPGKNSQPSASLPSSPTIADILNLLSSPKLNTEMKHAEDTSVLEDYESESYSGDHIQDKKQFVDYSLIALPSRKCRNTRGGRKNCGQRRLTPK
ncbi:unnamed protein product [Allacma fusca]|uniref:Uncharacterized protein n=1 Tax=Allacma fusca TaxID=39272 RepID=A0A8J2LJ15_9HEXA|nr:unnamed protein product [Allacma fusca]